MALSKEELQERAQLIRLYEAACNIAHPSDEDIRFRAALMRKIGVKYDLREMRNWTVGVPAGGVPPRANAAAAVAAKPTTQPAKTTQPPRRD